MSIEQTTVTAPDIVCGGCANAIKNAFGRVDGVLNIEVDVRTKHVSVEHEASINREDILKVLEDVGFSGN